MSIDHLKPVMLCCVLSLIIYGVWGPENSLTTYHRGDSFWQLTWLSTHFSHIDWLHLITNCIAIYLMVYLFPMSFRLFLKAALICALAVGLFVVYADIRVYLGLSALLYIFPGQATGKLIKQQKYGQAIVIGICLIVYVAISMYQSNNAHYYPMVSAHIIGFLSGLLVYYSPKLLPAHKIKSIVNKRNKKPYPS